MRTKQYLFLCLFVGLFSGVLTAQVSFTQHNNMIGSYSSSEDCAVDMNGDYLDDIVRITSAGVSIDFQQADGTFVQEIYAMSINNLPEWSVCAADINGDGHNDLLCGSGSNVSFLKSNGDGSGYTEQLITDYIFSQRSTFADIDNDGDVDAFVCHDIDLSHPYRNDGSGNMVEDQSLIETINLPGNYATIWVDYDNDGDSDMYLTKCRSGALPGDPARTNAMYRNEGDGTFTEVGEEVGMADNAQSWATVFEDFDNDGDFDAFIVNHDFQNRFYRNEGDGTFTDIIESTGIPAGDLGAWENAAGDFNNDGYVDIFSELQNAFYMNNGDMTFSPVDMFLDDGGIGDFNNDGFLDVIKGTTVYLNDANENNYVKISTEGIISNWNGLGARVEIHGSWGIQIREVRAGQSFSPMSSLNVHFGIGDATAIDQIVVKWPSGIITTLDNPAINTQHHMIEADCLLDPSELELVGNNIICPGDEVTLNAPTGYDSYLWSNGATTNSIIVSQPGTYSAVLYNEENCASVASGITITYASDDAPTIEVDGELLICEGSSVTLTSSLGSAYQWSNNATTQSIEVTEAGSYYVGIEAVCSTDFLNSEAIEVAVLVNEEPIIDDITLGADDAATIEATGENLEWYAAATGGDALATGNTYVTPPLTDNTTYYVEAHTIYGGELEEGGKPNPDGAGSLPSTGAYSYFDAFEPFTIQTVDVLVPEESVTGIRTIQLVDGAGQILTATSVDLEIGLNTITLNFEVPIGTGLTLRCPENNLFRNSGGVNYPYAIGTVGSITGSFYGEDYYYYFYNWQIEKERHECVSDRVAADVIFISVEELTHLSAIEVFPNPASDLLSIQFEATQNKAVQLELMDVLGRTVAQKNLNSLTLGINTTTFDVSDLPTGIYQLQLQMDGKTAAWKVVIE